MKHETESISLVLVHGAFRESRTLRSCGARQGVAARSLNQREGRRRLHHLPARRRHLQASRGDRSDAPDRSTHRDRTRGATSARGRLRERQWEAVLCPAHADRLRRLSWSGSGVVPRALEGAT